MRRRLSETTLEPVRAARAVAGAASQAIGITAGWVEVSRRSGGQWSAPLPGPIHNCTRGSSASAAGEGLRGGGCTSHQGWPGICGAGLSDDRAASGQDGRARSGERQRWIGSPRCPTTTPIGFGLKAVALARRQRVRRHGFPRAAHFLGRRDDWQGCVHLDTAVDQLAAVLGPAAAHCRREALRLDAWRAAFSPRCGGASRPAAHRGRVRTARRSGVPDGTERRSVPS